MLLDRTLLITKFRLKSSIALPSYSSPLMDYLLLLIEDYNNIINEYIDPESSQNIMQYSFY